MSEVLDDPMQMLNSQSNPPLILVNITHKRVASNQDEIDDEDTQTPSVHEFDFQNFEEYESSIKLYVQHFEIFVDKLMVGTTLKNFIKLQ